VSKVLEPMRVIATFREGRGAAYKMIDPGNQIRAKGFPKRHPGGYTLTGGQFDKLIITEAPSDVIRIARLQPDENGFRRPQRWLGEKRRDVYVYDGFGGYSYRGTAVC